MFCILKMMKYILPRFQNMTQSVKKKIKDCMKKFCESLREHAIKIIN